MSIEDRLKALASDRSKKLASYCATRKARMTALEELCYKLLKWEYEAVPDEYKEQWLNEQETKKAI
jgi:hypothetical protein